ncbi:iron-containing alcohol dehydrogenase [Chelatococcus reniformis]|nr:iron-containing alcohol dehydrogenase [Chelatococcus reniformis]
MRSGYHRPAPGQSISYGVPARQAVPDAIRQLCLTRVVLVTNRSLANSGGLIEGIRAAIGAAYSGEFDAVRAHVPRENVTGIATLLRDTEADGVVGLGGGSVCDAIKAARLCLANNILDHQEMDRLLPPFPAADPRPPYIMIPTTLSAGEYTSIAGFTNEAESRKQGYFHAEIAPSIVILDARMTLATPPRLWHGTGMRSIDHIVETWCSTNSTPLSDATTLHAASLLPNALLASRKDPDDMASRLDCQIGAWLASQGMAAGVNMGASHGIGHALGGVAGMPHGETSCVMLPHVLRFNASANNDRQSALLEAMGSKEAALDDAVAQLVSVLGLPARLRDAGVRRDNLPHIAEVALRDAWVQANPRPIPDVQTLGALLECAW